MPTHLDQDIVFQKILFEPCDQKEQIQRLTTDQQQRLFQCVAQKIACQTVYKPSYPQQNLRVPDHYYAPPNCLSSFFCCFFPQDNKEQFEITSSLFAKKILHTFLIWKDDFLSIKDDQQPQKQSIPDLYGPLWLTITYIIILGLTANLNDYFTNNPDNFTFKLQYLAQALVLSTIFQFVQIILYPAIISCLGGDMTNTQSANLTGYSLILYFLPTILCIFPSSLWHMIMLNAAALFRWIFLSRNYSSRAVSYPLIIYIWIVIIELLHFYIIYRTFYQSDAGPTIQSGFDKVFHLRNFQY